MERRLPELGWENKSSGVHATIVHQEDAEYVWYIKPGGISRRVKRAAFLSKWRHAAPKRIDGIPTFRTLSDSKTTTLLTSWRGGEKGKLTIARSILSDAEPMAIINMLRGIIKNIEDWLRKSKA